MAYKTLADSLTDDFEKLYIGNEYLRDLFANFIASKELPKGILIIHGVGGVGKSSLLRMYRLHCQRIHVPIAMTSGDEAKSAVDVLSNWSSDLTNSGVTLSNFQKSLVHYKTIQGTVEGQVKKGQEARKKGVEKASASVIKAVIGTPISLLPGGQIVDSLGVIGVDAVVDWLNGFLTKSDVDLLLDPVKVLTKYFLEDVAKIAQKRRLVFILDTFEHMSALSDWVCDIVQQLDSNILLVIAGREMVNWDRRWAGWLAHAQVVELQPMNNDDMRELANRYYVAIVGGKPDSKQIEAIIKFSRGLPMVVATAVRLWVAYGQGFDIEQRTEIYSDIVNRLREGIPNEYVPILESASIVRWFNKSILRALTKQDDVDAAYNELSKFSFIKSSRNGLTLHDSVREIFERNIRADKSEYFKELHARAVIYFRTEMERASGEEGWSLGLEWLYHVVRFDEKAGLQKYQKAAEGLLGYHQKDRLLTLLNDLDSYVSGLDASPNWLTYFKTRLDDLERDDEVDSFLDRVVAQEPNKNKTNQFSKSEKPLSVFLCHSSDDKPRVKQLYDRLVLEEGIDPWLDAEKLLPGVDWDLEIKSAVKASHVVLVCLSKNSINKEGYIQKEIRQALDVADEKPDRTIFIIPLRLENCEVPYRLKRWQWLDLFEKDSYDKLLSSLRKRANDLTMKSFGAQ
jgi:hypothetical protein